MRISNRANRPRKGNARRQPLGATGHTPAPFKRGRLVEFWSGAGWLPTLTQDDSGRGVFRLAGAIHRRPIPGIGSRACGTRITGNDQGAFGLP